MSNKISHVAKRLYSHEKINRRQQLLVVNSQQREQVIQPLNGDPFIGMLETPVTSAPIVANYLSNLPAYRTGVAPLLRGVEVGLAHGFFLPGPFIKLGPLRAVNGTAEVAGCMSAAGLVIILAVCLSIYGAVSFQRKEITSVKTLSGRELSPDEWQTSAGWSEFTSGWVVGGLSGVLYCYLCTQFFPYYS
jgi:photosystem I subunit 11